MGREEVGKWVGFGDDWFICRPQIARGLEVEAIAAWSESESWICLSNVKRLNITGKTHTLLESVSRLFTSLKT